MHHASKAVNNMTMAPPPGLKTRERLPTLFEVLNRRTQSPVDLWSFYVFMREQYRGVDYLDFWLDVVQHLALCRHYIRGLRQSILASPDFDHGSDRASSLLLEQLLEEGVLDDSDSHRLSAFLRGEDASTTAGSTINRLSNLLEAMNAKEQGIADLHSPSSRSENFMTRVNQNDEAASGGRSSYFGHVNSHAPSAGHSARLSNGTGANSIIYRSGAGDGDRASDRAADSYYSSYNESRMFHGSGIESYYQRDAADNDNGPPLHVGYSGSGFTDQQLQEQQEQQYSQQQQLQQQQHQQQQLQLQQQEYGQSPHMYASSNATDPLHPGGTDMGVAYSNAQQRGLRTSKNSSLNQSTGSRQSAISQLFPRRENDLEDGKQFVSRADIRQSAQRILVTYFIVGAERELPLPQHIIKQVKYCIEVEGRDDPEVFDEAREYAFQAMERDAFPSFLAAKALGNVQPSESLFRLIFGLFALFAAFWVGFILIFLDWEPKVTRLWLILPFGVGSYSIFSSLYNLDPIMAICGFSEASSRKVVRIREPYVRQLLVKRALYVLAVIILVAAILVIIFALVPGKRL